MTSEEMQRNFEFISASLARLAAAHEDRKNEIREHDRLMKRLAKMQVQLSELAVHQSERMDRFDRVHEELNRDIKRLLNMILERLPPIIH
jgi:hypothetical protein